ncbi:MAG: L-histidine N(alpha)-methyltransferase [Pyrinomonadaceae bacterium]
MAIEGARKSPDRLVVHYLPTIMRGDTDEFAVDVRAGLTIQPKRLFPKYFYDEMGSRLFEIICLLPEYYLTRAENEIFALHAGEIVERFDLRADRLLLWRWAAAALKRLV